MNIPQTEPTALFTGDTWTWRRELPEYSAADGWTLKYVLVNAEGRIDITSSADGTGHLVNVPASTSSSYTAGTYTWQSYVEKSGQSFTVAQSQLLVNAGLSAGSGGQDLRSQAQIALDDATAALAAYTATRGLTQEYSIAGRSMKFRSLQEIRDLINFWARKVNAEAAAERARTGKGPQKILTRFGS